MRPKLSLSKRPSPESQPKVDPLKVELSEKLGVRFVMRDHRYICQKLVVSYYESGGLVGPEGSLFDTTAETSRTWIDVPLVPEAYVG